MESKPRFFERDSFCIAALAAVVIAFCSRLLFTDRIIRASDVVTQFIWDAKRMKDLSVLDYLKSFPGIFRADWDMLSDGGRTLEGGWNAINLLFHRYLILHFFPLPTSIAWLAVLAMCWGAIGVFSYSRLVGIGRLGAFVAGLLYVLCTENSSLLNAGHIQKLEAICWFPWILFFLEKALRSGRFFHFALAALMLAIQFFHMHWQISFYSCLAVGAYCCFHAGAHLLAEKGKYFPRFRKELVLVAAMVALFFSTIAMSFAPLVSWSKQSERGDAVASGDASAGSGAAAAGGIGYEEGMSWSLPPEEILTFFVPGLVGYSRQEAGDVPTADDTYYWGRMRFTQTSDYLGLLPWFLIPLPLLFRRDRTTWFLTFLMAATLVMALGKYTFVYRFMFEHLPAFSKFRVPKMILFLFAFGAAVLAGRGIDILAEGEADRRKMRWWLGWCAAVVAGIGLLRLFLSVGQETVLEMTADFIAAPTRYQQNPVELVPERYLFMVKEATVAFGVAAVYLALFVAWYRKWLAPRIFFPILILFTLFDLWRVDRRFFVLTDPPVVDSKAAKTDIVKFLEPRVDHYRVQPLNDENAHYYADQGFANLSAYVTISERRYKEFLDAFNLASPMGDIMNLKYLVMPAGDFEAQKAALAQKYLPVFSSLRGSVVLENRTVLPKAWLVPSVAVVQDPQQRLGIMANDRAFNPAAVAIVESPPPLQMSPYDPSAGGSGGRAVVQTYEANRIVVDAQATTNVLLVLGEKYYRGWKALVDGKAEPIQPVDHVLRGVYLPAGSHRVDFYFDPAPFKTGKWLTLASFALFAAMLAREWRIRRGSKRTR